MNRKSTYVGEYELLDIIPGIGNTEEGVRANLYEPKSGSFFSKVFKNKESQIFAVRTPGVHKICFEGTKNLFQTIDSVRVSIRMKDDIKHDKLVEKALKTNDIKEAQETMISLGNTLNQILQAIDNNESKLNDFENLKNQYISRMAWSYIITTLIIFGCSAFEAYLFRKGILISVDKFK